MTRLEELIGSDPIEAARRAVASQQANQAASAVQAVEESEATSTTEPGIKGEIDPRKGLATTVKENTLAKEWEPFGGLIKKPEHDQAYEDKLKKRGQMSTLGRTLGNLAMFTGASKGGLVPRVNNNHADNFERLMQLNRDRYDRDKRYYDNAVMNEYLTNLRYHRAADEAEKGRKFRAEEAEKGRGFNREMTGEGRAFQAGEAEKSREFRADESQKQRDWLSQQNQLKWLQSLQASQAKQDAQNNKPWTMVNVNGQDIPLTYGQAMTYYNRIMNDQLFDPEDISTLMGQFQNNPDGAVKQIISKYAPQIIGSDNYNVVSKNNPRWNQQQTEPQHTEQFANWQDYMNTDPYGRGEYHGPIRPGENVVQTQPLQASQTTPKIDYSQFGQYLNSKGVKPKGQGDIGTVIGNIMSKNIAQESKNRLVSEFLSKYTTASEEDIQGIAEVLFQ